MFKELVFYCNLKVNMQLLNKLFGFLQSYKSATDTMKKLFDEENYDKRLRPYYKGNRSTFNF